MEGQPGQPRQQYRQHARQLVCHFNVARNKPEWNLEPSRPYTSNEDSIAKGCNNT
ncbi:hypothetical protein PGPR2_18315 [Pseudomonas aeruginosa PGPR2]|nr:hypothetical protein PGPR2_18315 [Pseudomonas aeruginosa PGPR2]